MIDSDCISHCPNFTQIPQKYRYEFFKSVKKLQKFFTIVHLHANNYNKCNNDAFPINVEITFCKNKYLTQTQDRLYNFPIKNLDYPNNSTLPDIEINFQKDGSFS